MLAGPDLRAPSFTSGERDRLIERGLPPFEFSRERPGEGDLVEMVETENEEDAERILLEATRNSGSSLCRSCFRPLSCSNLASCSSATPFLRGEISHQHKSEHLEISSNPVEMSLVCGLRRMGNP